jgi:hypothetical protein
MTRGEFIIDPLAKMSTDQGSSGVKMTLNMASLRSMFSYTTEWCIENDSTKLFCDLQTYGVQCPRWSPGRRTFIVEDAWL